MKYILDLKDTLEVEALEELAQENSMTPEKYIRGIVLARVHDRLRGKLLLDVKRASIEQIKVKLKEKKDGGIN